MGLISGTVSPERYETTEDKSYLVALMLITFGGLLGSIALTGVMYAYFGSSSCKLNQFYITFNLLLCLGVCILSIWPKIQEANPKSGLAQAAMVTIYSTYLIASAITSEPVEDEENNLCNPVNEGSKTQTTTIVLGSLFTFLALAYSTSRAATQGAMLNKSDESSVPLVGNSERVRTAVDSGALSSRALDDDGEAGGPADDEQDGVQYSYSFFHFIFVIAACYLAMLISNVGFEVF